MTINLNNGEISAESFSLDSTYLDISKEGKITATEADIKGKITATSGEFNGAIYATSGTFTGNISGSKITASSFEVGTSGEHYFNVTSGGSVTAHNGTFTGHIDAVSGTFAGELKAATGTFSGTLSAAKGSFTGSLSGATGDFSGKITATEGKIGGWTISANGLHNGRISLNGSETGGEIDLGGSGKIVFNGDGNKYMSFKENYVKLNTLFSCNSILTSSITVNKMYSLGEGSENNTGGYCPITVYGGIKIVGIAGIGPFIMIGDTVVAGSVNVPQGT